MKYYPNKPCIVSEKDKNNDLPLNVKFVEGEGNLFYIKKKLH